MATLRVRRCNANHDMTMGRGALNYASASESTAQRVLCNLLLLLGEWFLDTSAGVPWIQPDGGAVEPILGRMPANLGYAEAVIKRAILTTDGVATITEFTLDFDRNTRKLSVTARGTTVDGQAWGVANVAPAPAGLPAS